MQQARGRDQGGWRVRPMWCYLPTTPLRLSRKHHVVLNRDGTQGITSAAGLLASDARRHCQSDKPPEGRADAEGHACGHWRSSAPRMESQGLCAGDLRAPASNPRWTGGAGERCALGAWYCWYPDLGDADRIVSWIVYAPSERDDCAHSCSLPSAAERGGIASELCHGSRRREVRYRVLTHVCHVLSKNSF